MSDTYEWDTSKEEDWDNSEDEERWEEEEREMARREENKKRSPIGALIGLWFLGFFDGGDK